ncbi:MAG: IS4 family transposase [Polyangiaceae bacterium]
MATKAKAQQKETAESDPKTTKVTPRLTREELKAFTQELFGDFLHAKRIDSISNATTGVLHAASLAIHAIGASYAAVTAGQTKHGIKQVDRLLSNAGFWPWQLFDPWVRFLLAQRDSIVVAMDWTEFEPDQHSTLCIYLITSHGRATPLVWRTVDSSTLKGKRNDYEYELVERLHEILPPHVAVTILADRGFGAQKLYAHLAVLGWDYVIRFRENILVEDSTGKSAAAAQWVGNGRAKMLRGAKVTEERATVPAVVLAHDKRMKQAWCLATSLESATASEVVALYGKRFTIEETFRDQKDNHFGLGLHSTHIGDERRRDRLLFLAAMSQAMLTLLGAASEQSGLDRTLKANTSKKRTMSLLRQGQYWFMAMPNMRPEWFERLFSAFDQIVSSHAECMEIFGII